MAESRRRQYDTREPELSRRIDELVGLASERAGLPHTGSQAESVRQLVVTALRLLEDHTAAGDLKLLNNAMKELRHAFRVFAPYDHLRKVACFGSARTQPGEPDWQQAFAFAERIVAEGWMVITGAGGGIMAAAQGGAGREASFGVNIRLPFEQRANDVIAGDHKLINFRYFFTRKVAFVKEAHAIVLFPGGFGTHDEGFEALTLIQTGKSEILPVVFVDAPGGRYWQDWQGYVDSHLNARGLIGPHDHSLYLVTDAIDAAVDEILNFYSNYHSSRYVHDQLLIRVRRAPSASELEALNSEFGDILRTGRIEVGAGLPEEADEAPECPRVSLHFERRAVGRLRQLIDRLNDLVPESASPPREASPHEIVAGSVPEEDWG